MNIEQANNLDFQDLLSKLGHEPVKVTKGGNEVWYYSPFRTENDPSFHIRRGKTYDWIWHDFGSGEGTTILDFICAYKNTTKKEALIFLDELYPKYKSGRGGQRKKTGNTKQASFLFPSQKTVDDGRKIFDKPEDNRDLEFIIDKPLQSPLIFSYLQSRRIDAKAAQKYFRLIHYRNVRKRAQKPYFGFGMKNESGGWEVRSASDDPKMIFKSALIRRDITIIPGRKGRAGGVNIFEGMLDFISLPLIFGTDRLSGDAIILHGLKMFNRACEHIKRENYPFINTFLDNNTPGHDTTRMFIDTFGARVTNHSPAFLPYTDLNDAWKDGYIPNFSTRDHFPSP